MTDTPRKIIQVATSDNCIVVLCDDGSVWTLPEESTKPGWWRMPPIPQEKDYETTKRQDRETSKANKEIMKIAAEAGYFDILNRVKEK
jgi:hypothetical protein